MAEDDFDQRSGFCDYTKGQTNNSIANMLCSEKVSFNLKGHTNQHIMINICYWSEENPHWMQEYYTHPTTTTQCAK